jgi:hypothetical protein
MQYLLSIVDQFKIPVAKNRIEDAFYFILKDTIRPLCDEFRKGQTPQPHEHDTIARLLSFARRMNFNTDEFYLEYPA